MKNYKLLLITCACFMATSAFAIPAQQGVWQKITLANGTQVKVETFGDEDFHYLQDAAGNIYIADENGQYSMQSASVLQSTRQKAMARRTPRGRVSASPKDKNLLRGSKKSLVILAQFSDLKFQPDHDKAFYERVIRERNLKLEPFYGSVRDYFWDQSNGLFDFDVDVVGPVTISGKSTDYQSNILQDKVPDFIKAACQAAKSYVNYADYDWDGDNIVDMIFVLYAGTGAADSQDKTHIWPEADQLNNGTKGTAYKINGVQLLDYACGPELRGVTGYDDDGVWGYTGETAVAGIGTICHELSHCFGFADHYGSNTRTIYGMGSWDLMARGNYNGNSYLPANYTGYERWWCGWEDPVILDKDMKIQNMKPLSEHGTFYLLSADRKPITNENLSEYRDSIEFYIFENRQLTGWDAGLATAHNNDSHGMLAYHVNYKESLWKINNVNPTIGAQRMTVMPADNDSTVGYKIAYSGDLYPYRPEMVFKTYMEETHPELTSLREAIDFYNEANGCKMAYEPNNTISGFSKPALLQMRGGYITSSTRYPMYGRALTNITENADGTISFDFTYDQATIDLWNDVAEGRTTGIQNIESERKVRQENHTTYTLDGRQVDGQLAKGIYIRNGKKFVVK